MQSYSDQNGKHFSSIRVVKMPNCCITGTENGDWIALILLQFYTDGRRFLINLREIMETRSTRSSHWNFKIRKWPWWTVPLFMKQRARKTDLCLVLAGDPSVMTITFTRAIFFSSLSFSPRTFLFSYLMGREHQVYRHDQLAFAQFTSFKHVVRWSGPVKQFCWCRQFLIGYKEVHYHLLSPGHSVQR